MPSLSSPTQSMDTVYPEPMSRLHRRVVPKKRRGGSSRYRTQPVTFSEIQEVDEENVVEEAIPESSTSKSELSLLNKKFEEFKRTRDIDALLSNKPEGEIVDINKNVPLTTSRSIGRLPSRPSF
ncbi:uncharacterized protein LOC108911292 isoform X1 [Anoplophora glabripennis]|uniref:uncharacterized protein LOC108911292 isoform X1 n=2 Tax=Anoplophora glabripennis TaxID=217634 RepID=UPI0008742621|nr:uncharacterized protein LOC108911292 isoform X1 [Anoplophora glabripennis]